jgi:hypothetical protein
METKICQNCGMPMKTAEEFGTNGDDTPNSDYCCFCFQKGNFTQDMTMPQEITHSVFCK